MTDVPKPLLAALGAFAEIRRLPSHAISLGVTLLGASYKLREDYAALAARGEQVVAEVFGGGETPVESAVPPVDDVLAEETAVVQSAVAHVADPLDRPRTLPEPLPGYDGMTLGALRGRLRSLTSEDLDRVLAYERVHANRIPVVTLLEHRAAKLAAE